MHTGRLLLTFLSIVEKCCGSGVRRMEFLSAVGLSMGAGNSCEKSHYLEREAGVDGPKEALGGSPGRIQN